MNTYQRIKSLESVVFLIGSKELTENENSEVADDESKLQRNCKEFCLIGVYQLFQTL